MADVGANPARIIPAWRDFVASIDGGGGRARGIGEPIWAERTPTSWSRPSATRPCSTWPSPGCRRGGSSARTTPGRSVPTCSRRPSGTIRSSARAGSPGRAPPTAGWSRWPSRSRRRCRPPGPPAELGFGSGSLAGLRDLVARRDRGRARPDPGRRPRPGRRRGRHQQPAPRRRPGNAADLAGRRGTGVRGPRRRPDREPHGRPGAPAAGRDGGRGLWMVNQLCDLVQLRSFPDGATVRVHMYLP